MSLSAESRAAQPAKDDPHQKRDRSSSIMSKLSTAFRSHEASSPRSVSLTSNSTTTSTSASTAPLTTRSASTSTSATTLTLHSSLEPITQTSRLLALPTELRHQILSHILHAPEPLSLARRTSYQDVRATIFAHDASCPHRHFWCERRHFYYCLDTLTGTREVVRVPPSRLELLRVCRALAADGAQLFFGGNAFEFAHVRDLADFVRATARGGRATFLRDVSVVFQPTTHAAFAFGWLAENARLRKLRLTFMCVSLWECRYLSAKWRNGEELTLWRTPKAGAMGAPGMKELLELRGLTVVEVKGWEPYPADDPEWVEISVQKFLAPLLVRTLKQPRLDR